jgi:hypothetical protein
MTKRLMAPIVPLPDLCGVQCLQCVVSRHDRFDGYVAGSGLATFLSSHLARFAIEVCGEVAKLPLGLWVSGAVGNIATLFGAFAE